MSAGLDLIGLDLSQATIGQLADRLPHRRNRLVVGDLEELPPDTRYPLVVGIQVFSTAGPKRPRRTSGLPRNT